MENTKKKGQTLIDPNSGLANLRAEQKSGDELAKSRKGIVTSLVILGVLAIGTITTLCVLEALNTKAISELEAFITRYEELRGPLTVEPENADATTLASELSEFGNKNRAYPAAKALLIAGEIYNQKKQWADAQTAFETAAKKGAKTHIEPVAIFNAAVAAEEEDRLEAAATLYAKCAAYPDFSGASLAQFSLARVKEADGDIEAALSAYRELNTKWPDSTWSNLARSRIVKLD